MKKNLWMVPALASVLFLAFTLKVMATESPFGFVTEHLRNGWGMQIGIDLFSAATVALLLSRPYRRKHNIRMWPWVLLTVATGSIGLFAFAARILYAEGRASDKSNQVPDTLKFSATAS